MVSKHSILGAQNDTLQRKMESRTELRLKEIEQFWKTKKIGYRDRSRRDHAPYRRRRSKVEPDT